VQEICIDAELELANITPKFFRVLNQIGPFGPENMSPVFVSRNVQAYGGVNRVGSNHIKMSVYQNSSPWFDCIAFNQGECIEEIRQGKPFDICYTIEENIWRDKRSIQLNIKGIRC
jgi:single-stranded-DNA-specific exonuclease